MTIKELIQELTKWMAEHPDGSDYPLYLESENCTITEAVGVILHPLCLGEESKLEGFTICLV